MSQLNAPVVGPQGLILMAQTLRNSVANISGDDHVLRASFQRDFDRILAVANQLAQYGQAGCRIIEK